MLPNGQFIMGGAPQRGSDKKLNVGNQFTVDKVREFLSSQDEEDPGYRNKDRLELVIMKQEFLEKNNLFDPKKYFGGLDMPELGVKSNDSRLDQMFEECFTMEETGFHKRTRSTLVKGDSELKPKHHQAMDDSRTPLKTMEINSGKLQDTYHLTVTDSKTLLTVSKGKETVTKPSRQNEQTKTRTMAGKTKQKQQQQQQSATSANSFRKILCWIHGLSSKESAICSPTDFKGRGSGTKVDAGERAITIESIMLGSGNHSRKCSHDLKLAMNAEKLNSQQKGPGFQFGDMSDKLKVEKAKKSPQAKSGNYVRLRTASGDLSKSLKGIFSPNRQKNVKQVDTPASLLKLKTEIENPSTSMEKSRYVYQSEEQHYIRPAGRFSRLEAPAEGRAQTCSPDGRIAGIDKSRVCQSIDITGCLTKNGFTKSSNTRDYNM
eukprot:TRINITY_DN2606_c0_g1_i3.p1 TRINITY_DN2606_c0_g1~~TRINITY_DN2606_c0_g1_i3.p1  ORF type:complete len:433 (-),score=78.06 TRINITY_DN2606_c0_g1_i3:161-1459(-)